jgi:hypothetical protein
VDNYFEFAIAIQIEDGRNIVEIGSIGDRPFGVDFTGHELRLNFAADYAPQDHD